jgi:hypothetical protein
MRRGCIVARKHIFRYKKQYVKKVDLKYHDTGTKRRYRLDVELQKGNSADSVLLVMMNPSEADDKISDNTINRAIQYIFLNSDEGVLKNIGKIVFTNLYVVYETYSDKVNELTEQHSWEFIKGIEAGGNYNNNDVISNAKTDAKIVIIAWGKGDIEGYDDRILEVLELLDDKELYHVRELTKGGHPRHPRNWSYDWSLEKYIP